MYRAKFQFLGAMGIFGTIGLFIRYIPLPSAAIAFFRGIVGLVFLAAVMLLTRKKPDLTAIRKNLVLLLLSGGAMGLNWVLLFESYRYTTIATATVCYYLAPLLLLLASPLLGERLTAKKLLCILVALVGLMFVSGFITSRQIEPREIKGVLFGIGAAVLYATVMFLNKKLSPIPAYDKTVIQLGSAALVLLPYLLLTGGLSSLTAVVNIQPWQQLLLLFVCVVHTGVAYMLYFGAIRDLNAHTVAVFSYLDPVLAILASALIMGEAMSIANVIGTVLILGSALYSELPDSKK